MNPPSATGAMITPPLHDWSPPEVDFHKFTLLVVASGSKPSAGYSVVFQDI